MSKRQCLGSMVTGSMWDSLTECKREQYDTLLLTPLTHHLLKVLVECIWQYYEDEWKWDQCPIEVRETVTQKAIALWNPGDVKAFHVSITNFEIHGTYMQPSNNYYTTPRVQLRLSTKHSFKSGLELWKQFGRSTQKPYPRTYDCIRDSVEKQFDMREFIKLFAVDKISIVLLTSHLLVFKDRSLFHIITPPCCVFCSGTFSFLDIVPIKRDDKSNNFIVSLRCGTQVAIKHLVFYDEKQKQTKNQKKPKTKTNQKPKKNQKKTKQKMWFITGEFELAVQVNGDTFDLWKLGDPQLILENVPFIKLFVGIAFDEETGKREPKADGNALLIEYKPKDSQGYHYMIISNYVEQFTTTDRILQFYSPQNNASYPFAMSETHMYDLVLHRIIPRFLPDVELHKWAFTHDVKSFAVLHAKQIPLPE